MKIEFGAAADDAPVPTSAGVSRLRRSMIENWPSSPAEYAYSQEVVTHWSVCVLVVAGARERMRGFAGSVTSTKMTSPPPMRPRCTPPAPAETL